MTLRKTAVIFTAALLLFVSAFWLGTAQAVNESTYTISIPDNFAITQSGWNKLGSISVDSTAGNFAKGGVKVTVASSNNFALVSGTNSIGYTYTTAESPDEKITEFTFARTGMTLILMAENPRLWELV